MCTREGLPGQSPIAPSQARLTLEFLVMGFRKKLLLIGMSILIDPIKPWAGMSHYSKKVSTEETSLEEERSKYTFGRPITTRVIN
jgi:hypothetical protein